MNVIFRLLLVIPLMGGFSIMQQAYGKSSTQKEVATFSGGCFWCMEPPFEKLPGVSSVVSGYTGGQKVDPEYKEVASGRTKHIESVQITFDPQKVSYLDLLEVFWRNVNPTDQGGQFVDRGHQYSTAIFYHDERQKKLAIQSKAALQKSGRFDKDIVTPIIEAGPFYNAEDYHQDYYKKNPVRYKYYRFGSGRDDYLDKTWGKNRIYKPNQKTKKVKKMKSTFVKPSKDQLKEQLTKIQFKVTQKDGTEPPFRNEYWDNKEPGIYVDVVSGEPLFSSTDKFKSGTGWPSFTQPIQSENIVEKTDTKLFMKRTEVRSKLGDSHLGHVFNDGPQPTGMRYCINSAALRFIPVGQLASKGYEEFEKLFKSSK